MENERNQHGHGDLFMQKLSKKQKSNRVEDRYYKHIMTRTLYDLFESMGGGYIFPEKKDFPAKRKPNPYRVN